MLKFNIRMEEKENILNIPSVWLNKLKPWLDRNHIEYTILSQDELPDEVEHFYIYKGRKSFIGVAGIKSKMNKEDLLKTVEAMHDIPENEI